MPLLLLPKGQQVESKRPVLLAISIGNDTITLLERESTFSPLVFPLHTHSLNAWKHSLSAGEWGFPPLCVINMTRWERTLILSPLRVRASHRACTTESRGHEFEAFEAFSNTSVSSREEATPDYSEATQLHPYPLMNISHLSVRTSSRSHRGATYHPKSLGRISYEYRTQRVNVLKQIGQTAVWA